MLLTSAEDIEMALDGFWARLIAKVSGVSSSKNYRIGPTGLADTVRVLRPETVK
jgi:hypothetical protein